MTLNCNGKLIDLETPKVMGILNLTPNSFFDGGKYKTEGQILQQVEKMLLDGATFIDVGAYSSKPNAAFVDESTEIARLLPVVKSILAHFPEVLLSVDTFRSQVAAAVLDCGVAMINDISAENLDDKMLETIARYKVPYCMMHMKGTPNTMQSLTQYDDIILEIQYYFAQKVEKARSLGIHDIIIDPGFGFAKTIEQNFEILKQLALFKIHELPILAGISRKSMVYKTLGTSPENALNGSTVLNTIALQNGAKILRIHDVKEAMECILLVEKIS
jgi:dihydropteroate synthase